MNLKCQGKLWKTVGFAEHEAKVILGRKQNIKIAGFRLKRSNEIYRVK